MYSNKRVRDLVQPCSKIQGKLVVAVEDTWGSPCPNTRVHANKESGEVRSKLAVERTNFRSAVAHFGLVDAGWYLVTTEGAEPVWVHVTVGNPHSNRNPHATLQVRDFSVQIQFLRARFSPLHFPATFRYRINDPTGAIEAARIEIINAHGERDETIVLEAAQFEHGVHTLPDGWNGELDSGGSLACLEDSPYELQLIATDGDETRTATATTSTEVPRGLDEGVGTALESIEGVRILVMQGMHLGNQAAAFAMIRNLRRIGCEAPIEVLVDPDFLPFTVVAHAFVYVAEHDLAAPVTTAVAKALVERIEGESIHTQTTDGDQARLTIARHDTKCYTPPEAVVRGALASLHELGEVLGWRLACDWGDLLEFKANYGEPQVLDIRVVFHNNSARMPQAADMVKITAFVQSKDHTQRILEAMATAFDLQVGADLRTSGPVESYRSWQLQYDRDQPPEDEVIRAALEQAKADCPPLRGLSATWVRFIKGPTMSDPWTEQTQQHQLGTQPPPVLSLTVEFRSVSEPSIHDKLRVMNMAYRESFPGVTWVFGKEFQDPASKGIIGMIPSGEFGESSLPGLRDDTLKTERLVALQPLAWHPESRYIAYSPDPERPESLTLQQLGLCEEATYFDTALEPATFEQHVGRMCEQDERAPLLKLFAWARDQDAEFMTGYGLHQVGVEDQATNAKAVLANLWAAIQMGVCQGALRRTLMFCPSTYAIEPDQELCDRLGVQLTPLADLAGLDQFPAGVTTLVVSTPNPPPFEVFQLLQQHSTLPVFVSASNTANLLRMLGKPHLPIGRTYTYTDLPEHPHACSRLRRLCQLVMEEETRNRPSDLRVLSDYLIQTATEGDDTMGGYFNTLRLDATAPSHDQLRLALKRLHDESPRGRAGLRA